MKRNLFLSLLLILSSLSINAQATFQKTLEVPGMRSYASVLKKTPDNGFIMGGSASDSLNNSYAYLLKMDSAANVIWSKSFGSIGNSYITDIIQIEDNGFLIHNHIMQNSSSSIDLLIRTDSIGDTLWTKAFGGVQDRVAGNSIIQTSDKGFFLTGSRFLSTPSSNSDIYVIKTDSMGNPIWTKTYDAPLSFSSDAGFRSVQLNDGSILTLCLLHYASGEVSYFLINHDSSGNLIWSKNITTPNIALPKYFEQTDDGGFIIAGSIKALTLATNDIHVLKTDSIGNIIWSKIYSGGAMDEDPYEVHQTPDGGYLVVGNSKSWNRPSTFLIKTDFNGDTLWTKGYGDGATVYTGVSSVVLTEDGGYLLAGGINTYPPTNGMIHLIKTDSTGNSGCYELNHPFTVTSPVSLVINTPVDSSSGITVNSVSIFENSLIFQPVTLCPVGMDDILSNLTISIYPNPVETFIYISFQNQNVKNVSFSVKNILGQTMYHENYRNINSQNEYKFDLSFLSNGIYLLDVIVDGERTVEKIVKQ